ncbi:MAG: DUF6544 family protein [Actinomycetota bacterium]
MVVVADLEQRLATPAAPGHFTQGEIEGLPEPVRRFFNAAIAPGTPLATSARFRSRGSIKIKGWKPFRSRQVEAPHDGFVWAARVGGLISGYDYYADGRGAMNWKVLALVTVVDADTPDHARSAAGRAGAESIWVPTAMLPRFGVEWTAEDDTHITSRHPVDDLEVEIRYVLDSNGRITSISSERWGDPDDTGEIRSLPSGADVTGHATFGGVTVPSRGTYGWFHGTPRWEEGKFFRFEIVSLELIA